MLTRFPRFVGDWNPNKVSRPDISAEAAAAAAAAVPVVPAVEVQLETSNSNLCGHDLKNCFWLPIPALSTLGINLDSRGEYHVLCNGTAACGSVVANGFNLTVRKLSAHNRQDACGFCHNCSLAFMALGEGEKLPAGLQPGAKVKMSWSPFAGPRHHRQGQGQHRGQHRGHQGPTILRGVSPRVLARVARRTASANPTTS